METESVLAMEPETPMDIQIIRFKIQAILK